jgi:hypothetical protein
MSRSSSINNAREPLLPVTTSSTTDETTNVNYVDLEHGGTDQSTQQSATPTVGDGAGAANNDDDLFDNAQTVLEEAPEDFALNWLFIKRSWYEHSTSSCALLSSSITVNNK